MYFDLTHRLNEEISVFPGEKPPVLNRRNTIPVSGYNETLITMSSHSGTHIDAPAHLVENAATLDSLELDRFIGNAIVIDCRNRDSIDLDYIKTFEISIEQADFVLFYSGWQHKWNTEDYFQNYPVLTREASEWLTGFELSAVGFDYISIDPVDSKDLINHYLFLKAGIMIIENLTNLDKLPINLFKLFCIPLSIENIDGSPVRVFAEIN